MAVKFEIESVFKITGRGYFVTAKLVEEGKGFWLPENSKLGNIEITTSLTQPRAIDENGNVRLDLWAFQLKNDSDSEKFKEGEIVELFPGDEIKFLPPWMKIESKGNLEDELRKEISNEHLLFGKVVEAIAKREDNDDVLFKIGEQEMAVVHLTWKGKKESSSEYPKTKTFNHWTEVYERVIVTDNKEYEI
ncbi:hypothetical protein BFR04_08260 [Gaetbulibacter sp. 4G1]|nr:hypothetical protein [Gaetbulibacter sp. 4G1]PIA77431.1 hypothetical protein BFR04_08260 [Gaetbulibacter sp. 4G1]